MEKILLVDDVKLFLEIQKGYFTGASVNVITAANGQEALTVAASEKPNLVITDKFMPVMDGISYCRAMKKDPELKHIPIILLSNDIEQHEIDTYREAGFNEWLPKQVERKIYLDTARKYLNSKLRRDVRVPFAAQVNQVGQGDAPIGTATDISLSGLCVASEKPFSLNDLLTISFTIPGNDAHLEIYTKIAWIHTTAGVRYVGFEFIEIKGKGLPFVRRGDLKQFVEAKTRKAGN